MKSFYVAILLSVIVLFALIIRVYMLSTNPPGFFADEASIGYNAYTILKFGTDEHGVSYPLFFQAFGEYKNPIQIYLTTFFVYIFGLSVFSVRITSVFLSLATIIAVYFLAKELAKNLSYPKIVGILSAFLLSISPWHIHFSRVSLEGFMPFLLMTTLGTYFFLRFRENKVYFIFSAAFFSLGMYTYFPARIFIPLFAVSLVIVFGKDLLKEKSTLLLGFLLATIICLPLLLTMASGEGRSRWEQVSIFSHPPEEKSISQHVVDNYLSHYSKEYLFTKGDIDMPGQFITRHSVKGFGQLYYLQLPFILLGAFWLIRKKQYREFLVLFFWIILFPVGSMFTTDTSAQATRSIIGVVPFQVLSAVGVVSSIVAINKHHKILSVTFSVIVLWLFFFIFHSYLRSYFTSYTLYSHDFWGWQYGAEQVVSVLKNNQKKYDQLYLSPSFNSPDIFISFFAPGECKNCYVGLPDTDYDRNKKQLFSVTPDYLRQNSSLKFKGEYTIYSPGGGVAFLIGEIVE